MVWVRDEGVSGPKAEHVSPHAIQHMSSSPPSSPPASGPEAEHMCRMYRLAPGPKAEGADRPKAEGADSRSVRRPCGICEVSV